MMNDEEFEKIKTSGIATILASTGLGTYGLITEKDILKQPEFLGKSELLKRARRLKNAGYGISSIGALGGGLLAYRHYKDKEK